jgi:hypothetical protein
MGGEAHVEPVDSRGHAVRGDDPRRKRSTARVEPALFPLAGIARTKWLSSCRLEELHDWLRLGETPAGVRSQRHHDSRRCLREERSQRARRSSVPATSSPNVPPAARSILARVSTTRRRRGGSSRPRDRDHPDRPPKAELGASAASISARRPASTCGHAGGIPSPSRCTIVTMRCDEIAHTVRADPRRTAQPPVDVEVGIHRPRHVAAATTVQRSASVPT